MNTSGIKNIFSIAEINSSFTKFKFLSKHNYLFYNSLAQILSKHIVISFPLHISLKACSVHLCWHLNAEYVFPLNAFVIKKMYNLLINQHFHSNNIQTTRNNYSPIAWYLTLMVVGWCSTSISASNSQHAFGSSRGETITIPLRILDLLIYKSTIQARHLILFRSFGGAKGYNIHFQDNFILLADKNI